MNGDFEGSAKIKCDVGYRRETVEIAKPFLRTAAGTVAREGGVHVAIGEDEIIALEERHNLALAAVGKVGGVKQRKGCRRQKAALFAATRGGFDERRRVPFGEVKAIAADFEPAF